MGLLTLIQAAEQLNTSPAYVRVMIHRKKLKAVKMGRDWFVSQAEVNKLKPIQK